MRFLLIIMVLLVSVPVAADDELAVRSLYSKYQKAWLKNDETVEAEIMSLLTQDAVIMPQGQPILRENEIREFWFPRDAGTTVINNYEQTIDSVELQRDFAYLFGHFKLDFNWNGDAYRSGGTQLMVAKKTQEGWKIKALIWNSTPK